MAAATAANWLLGTVLFPLWLAASVGDYLCHRATRIEATSGLQESLTHLTMASLRGLGVIALVFLEFNILVLALLVLLFIAHEIVVQIDLRIAQPVRAVGPLEQQLHAFLEAVPLAALAVVAVVVLVEERYVVALNLRPIDPATVSLLFGAIGVFGALPYWEEFWRCLRHLKATRIVAS